MKPTESGLRALLVFVAFSFALGLIEAGIRIFFLSNPWTTQNFTVEVVNQQASNLAILYDPVIGYVPRGMYRWDKYSGGEKGIRLNATLPTDAPWPTPLKGGILAVGDSFTYGSEVHDSESWPAQLEFMLGMPVLNAGAGGYGIDQAVLRAEQLLDTVEPVAIVVSFIPNCVGRNEFSLHSGGLSKPYFDVVDGRLELRNVPVPAYRPAIEHIGHVRAILGYSYTLLWLADRLGFRSRWLVFEPETRVVHNKGAEVSCLLWHRLAERVAGRNIRLMALAQYAGIQVGGEDASRKSNHVEKILECAREAGYLVVDSYPDLRRAFETDPASFWSLWVKQTYDKGTQHTGHMSASGNRFTASLLSEAIRAELPELLQIKQSPRPQTASVRPPTR